MKAISYICVCMELTKSYIRNNMVCISRKVFPHMGYVSRHVWFTFFVITSYVYNNMKSVFLRIHMGFIHG